MENQDQYIEMARAFVEVAIGYGLDLAGALVILIVGWIAAGWARSSVRRALDRVPGIDDTLKPFFASTVRYVILVFVLVAVLAQFGVETTSIIAMLGGAALAIGLALQGTLQNIAAGMMLLLLRPFRAGDYIDAEGLGGTVNEIGLFTTRMSTADGVYREVPNSMLWNRAITNYSRLPTRRLDVTVGISYADDIETASAVLMALLESDERVHKEPAPQVLVQALADSSVNLMMRCWTSTSDYWALLFELNKAAKQRLEAAGFTIPFPQRDVHLHEVKAARAVRSTSARKAPATSSRRK